MDAQPEHARLKVYTKAREASRIIDGLSQGIHPRRLDLRDQLLRASASIPLNIAEDAAEFSPAEKARFYRMARRSSAECIAILDVAEDAAALTRDSVEARDSLRRVAMMLTSMVKTVEERRR